MKSISVLFVCLGNICRSPTAEGVFRKLSQSQNTINWKIESAGTAAHHQGEHADPRSITAAAKRGYDIASVISRQVSARDLADFDLILAMDEENLTNLKTLALQHQFLDVSKIQLFLDYSLQFEFKQVPDPYYGGASGFDQVIDLIEDASLGLLQKFTV